MEEYLVSKKELLQLLVKNNVLLDKELNDALLQVGLSHQFQKRDNDGPYLEHHIYCIVRDLIDYYNKVYPKKDIPHELILTALLHDVLEDDKSVTRDIFQKKFGKKILDNVILLTKVKHKDVMTYDEKVQLNDDVWQGVISSKNNIVILIKIADRYNNLLGSWHTPNPSKDKLKRFIFETKKNFLPYLKDHDAYYLAKYQEILQRLQSK